MAKLTRATEDYQIQSRTEKLRPVGQLVRRSVTNAKKSPRRSMRKK